MDFLRNLVVVAAVALLAVVLNACSPKELPLPEHERGIKTVTGKILECDFRELGTSGRTIFVGMTIDGPDAPYVRFNFPRDERPRYDTWCTQNTDVKIWYKAKSTELRPEITYWGEHIEKNET